MNLIALALAAAISSAAPQPAFNAEAYLLTQKVCEVMFKISVTDSDFKVWDQVCGDGDNAQETQE